jgi:DNA replication protein DnaC
MKYKFLRNIDKILVFIMKNVNNIHLYILNKYDDKKTKYKFLTANDNAKKVEEYSLALSEALEDEKVKNIAISGSYGSGKSSFIKTFEKNNSHDTIISKVYLYFKETLII